MLILRGLYIAMSGGLNFVEKMVEEAEGRQKHLFSGSEVTVKKLMESLCRKEGVCLSELRGGSRRRIISQIFDSSQKIILQ